jgi:hypothetical protein
MPAGVGAPESSSKNAPMTTAFESQLGDVTVEGHAGRFVEPEVVFGEETGQSLVGVVDGQVVLRECRYPRHCGVESNRRLLVPDGAEVSHRRLRTKASGGHDTKVLIRTLRPNEAGTQAAGAHPTPASELEDEIAHLRDLDLPGLRARWRSVFRRKAPDHLPRHTTSATVPLPREELWNWAVLWQM